VSKAAPPGAACPRRLRQDGCCCPDGLP